MTTDRDGRYDVIASPTDVYSLTFFVPGFTTATRHGIAVAPHCPVPVNVRLQPAIIRNRLTVLEALPKAVRPASVGDRIPAPRGPEDARERTTSTIAPRWFAKPVNDACLGMRPMWRSDLDHLLTRYGCQRAELQRPGRDLARSASD